MIPLSLRGDPRELPAAQSYPCPVSTKLSLQQADATILPTIHIIKSSSHFINSEPLIHCLLWIGSSTGPFVCLDCLNSVQGTLLINSIRYCGNWSISFLLHSLSFGLTSIFQLQFEFVPHLQESRGHKRSVLILLSPATKLSHLRPLDQWFGGCSTSLRTQGYHFLT